MRNDPLNGFPEFLRRFDAAAALLRQKQDAGLSADRVEALRAAILKGFGQAWRALVAFDIDLLKAIYRSEVTPLERKLRRLRT